MGKFVAAIGAFLGTLLAFTNTSMSMWYWFDEVETPESLIK